MLSAASFAVESLPQVVKVDIVKDKLKPLVLKIEKVNLRDHWSFLGRRQLTPNFGREHAVQHCYVLCLH